MSAISGIERQLFEFGPGQEAVLAEMLDEKIRGVATGPDAVRGKGVADHLGEVARAVGITADRGGARRIVEGAAQRGTGGQIARFGDDERIGNRVGDKPGEERRQRIAGLAHPHDAPPT